MNNNFPYWMAPAYKKYNGREAELPVDFHQLVALVAPRAVYVASGSEDWWADPKGEYLSLVHASDVYRLYGDTGLKADAMPGENGAIASKRLGYHLRKGPHDILLWD